VRVLTAALILLLAMLGAAWLRPVAVPQLLTPVEMQVSRTGPALGEGSERGAPAPPALSAAPPGENLRGQVNEAADTTVELEPTNEQRSAERSQAEISALSSTLCPEGMAWVAGDDFCPAPPELMTERGCPVPPTSIGVCMDIYEYPNQAGVLPAIMLRGDEANQLCKAEGKRLCRELEWTFACRSTREPTRCNFGYSAEVRVERLWEPASVSREIADRDGRWPSHATECVNDFGVHDLLGNVQEWAVSDMREYSVTLKGGRFNQATEGCDRSMHVTDPWLRFPHTGLRCCRDPLVRLPEP
jgi:Sulfatase-modifying factor enzyme 1